MRAPVYELAEFFEGMVHKSLWKFSGVEHHHLPKKARQNVAKTHVISGPWVFRALAVPPAPWNLVHAAVILEGDLAFTGNRFGAPFKLVPVEI